MGAPVKKRKSGIPTGNAGEYFVMGELLRRGHDAHLADRNTKDYDILVRRPTEELFRPIQVKTVRSGPWYVKMSQFADGGLARVTVYVLLGSESCAHAVRYFIAKNSDVAAHADPPKQWKDYGFMSLKALEPFENKWDALFS